MVKTEAYYINKIKKQKQKTWIRVSGHENTCAYIGLCVQPSYIRTCTSSLRMHARSMHTYTCLENPSPKTINTEHKAKPKIIKLTI